MTELLPWYFAYTINTTFITKPVAFENFMPVDIGDYAIFKQEFSEKYGNINRESWMIEHATLQGNGWIGLAHPQGDKEINQEFVAYEIKGDYAQMKDAYVKIMQDYPEAKGYYNLYLTDPMLTPMEENRTWILLEVE